MICRKGETRNSYVTGPPVMDPNTEYVNPGTEDQMAIEGYKLNKWKRAFTYLACVVTGGFLRLVFYWCPHWMLRWTHSPCTLGEAEAILLLDQYKQWFVSKVLLTTKHGTRIKEVKLSPSISFQPRRRNNPACTTVRDAANPDPDKEVEEALLSSPTLHTDDSIIRYFTVKKVKYLWNRHHQTFEKLRAYDESTMCSYFHETQGLTADELEERSILYGINSIQVSVTPIIVLLIKEVLSPFYVFQVFSMSVWYSDEYYIYATCILLITTVSINTSIYQTRSMQRALRNTIQASTTVTVFRGDNEPCNIQSEDLIPGDVIEIPRHGCIMQYDAVLVAGNCIVDESMLTGESVPVTKTPLPNPKLVKPGEQITTTFDIKEHARHILFCGTHIIQTRYYGNKRVRAVVVRTGFSTAKGELVRSILYPKPVDFKFERDTYIFVGVLAMIAGLGFIYTIILEIQYGEDAKDIALHSLDIITITVPPALPAALTVGIIFAQRRLKSHGIYCISPRAINIAGSINAVCFDKTGTLTEDGLMMQGVVPSEGACFQEEIRQMSDVSKGTLLVCMATCHSLTKIDGVLSGDPLDLIMFASVGWDLEEPGHEESHRFDMMVPTIVYPSVSPDVLKDTIDFADKVDPQPLEEYGILRQFTFSSSLQRMSVIVRQLQSTNFELYCKGSPEMIASLCRPSTVPDNFQSVLSSYTQHGYRVIALAWKPLSSKINYVKIQRMQREQVEKDLLFLGLLIMENKLKHESSPVISQLRDANIRTIMVTGDNILTALSVARECGMVDPPDKIILAEAFYLPGDSTQSNPQLEFVYADDRNRKVEEISTAEDMTIQIDNDPYDKFHFAVTGKSWSVLRHHFPEILPKIVVRGAVFARMSPGQKAQLIEVLQEVGYYVAMCGDGANDCGALKTAHTGISLSEAEASVASPFTSKTPNIKCVPTVIAQGRAALVTSFGIFKYMACYSLTQFISVCLLYWIGANMTDFEFLYVDLILVSTLSITFGRTEAHPKLAKEPPPFSLTSVLPILSLVIQISIQMSVQVFCFYHVQTQPWFKPYEENPDDNYISYENTAVFYGSAYQYIILAIVFAKGPPYRKRLFTNYLFLGNIIACTLVTMWLTIYPPEGALEFLELMPPDSIPYRLLYVGMAAANLLLSILLEMFVLDSIFVRKKCNYYAQKWLILGVHRYAEIEEEIDGCPDWPPVSPSSTSLSNGLVQMESQLSRIDPKDTDHILPPDTDTDTVSCKSSSSSPLKSVSSVEVGLMEEDSVSGQFDLGQPLLRQSSSEGS
ncbi:probable cation-transporting ATPase 13A3 isoform X2 [Mizuhopecten yessoensis]|uniref:probable cation-transporting ATPase 13A3 isoform X2 n=1 Tax=Mizuhopecten yessoensis TaxID=6573 RepID=UPI000B457D98|nr:probable cation-transporting ATPase 13A3 isoform X2 [Mizuhopecten yessoensis]